jgi:hypothetical protein
VLPDQEILCWQVGGAGLDSSPDQLATLACMVVAQKAWQRSPLLPHFFANQACLLSSPSVPAKDTRRPFQAKRGTDPTISTSSSNPSFIVDMSGLRGASPSRTFSQFLQTGKIRISIHLWSLMRPGERQKQCLILIPFHHSCHLICHE